MLENSLKNSSLIVWKNLWLIPTFFPHVCLWTLSILHSKTEHIKIQQRERKDQGKKKKKRRVGDGSIWEAYKMGQT